LASPQPAQTEEPISGDINSAMTTNVPPMKNYQSLKAATSTAAKSVQYVTSMPYTVNNTNGNTRTYSTKSVNINNGAPKPGIMTLVQGLRTGNQNLISAATGKKSMSAALGSTGGYVLNQEIAEEVIDPLRATPAVLRAGAQVEDMEGTQIKTIPRMKLAPTAYWVGDGNGVPQSQPVYDNLTLYPKALAVLVTRSFQFFQNITPRAEAQLRQQTIKSLALGIDDACLFGKGSADGTNPGASPLGLLNISGVTKTSLATNGATPTLQNITDANSRLDIANIPEGGDRAWIFHARTKNTFTSMTDARGLPILRETWAQGEEKQLIGYPYFTQNDISITDTTGTSTDTSSIYFGDWSYMTLGMANQVELVLDQTYAAQLQQGLLFYVYVDMVIHQSAAFQVLTGVRP